MFAAAAGHVGRRPGRCFCVPRTLPRHSLVRQLGGGSAIGANPPLLVIPGLTRNPGWLYAWYCVASLSSPANAPQGLVSEHGVTAVLRRLCCSAAIAAFATTCASLLVSLVRQLGCCSSFRASIPSRHSGLRAGILGGLMRGIALHYCLAGVQPRQRLPGSRIKCGMTAYCAAVPLRLSVRPPFFTLVIPGLTRNPGWLCARYCAASLSPPQRLPGSRVGARDDGAVAPVYHPLPLHCHLFFPPLSFRPPSRNLGRPYARYCIALLPRRCPSPPTPPRPRVGARGDGALRRCAIALPLHCRAFFSPVIRLRANWAAVRQPVQARLRSPCTNCPASERESWVALCAVLRCAIASPVSNLANASQGPASSAG